MPGSLGSKQTLTDTLARFARTIARIDYKKAPPKRSLDHWFIGFDQTVRSTIIFLMFAMAAAGFRPFGHVLAQFMIVWQR